MTLLGAWSMVFIIAGALIFCNAGPRPRRSYVRHGRGEYGEIPQPAKWSMMGPILAIAFLAPWLSPVVAAVFDRLTK